MGFRTTAQWHNSTGQAGAASLVHLYNTLEAVVPPTTVVAPPSKMCSSCTAHSKWWTVMGSATTSSCAAAVYQSPPQPQLQPHLLQLSVLFHLCKTMLHAAFTITTIYSAVKTGHTSSHEYQPHHSTCPAQCTTLYMPPSGYHINFGWHYPPIMYVQHQPDSSTLPILHTAQLVDVSHLSYTIHPSQFLC